MNILITGIHGFVGKNLVEALKADYLIFGLDINTAPLPGVERIFTWDELTDLPPYDVVIHLAGIAHDTKNWTNAQAYFDVNTGLTSKIYDVFLRSNAAKFIFFSSVKAAADSVNGILTEDIIPSPKGPYGESKLAAENYILAKKNRIGIEHESFFAKKKTYLLRPCMIHGAGNKGNLNLLFNMVQRGFPWPLGAFDNHRSFTSVDNLKYIIKALIMKDVKTGTYNISDDETLSTNQIITLIGKVLNKKIRILKLSPKFIQFAASVGTILHFPLNSERLLKLTENYVVSNAKIKKELGIDKLPVNAEDGLIITIKSFLK